MIILLFVAAMLLLGMGAGHAVNNKNRIEQYEQQYKESPQKILESEKARVDVFMKIYPQTIIVAAIMMVIGVCVFSKNEGKFIKTNSIAWKYCPILHHNQNRRKLCNKSTSIPSNSSTRHMASRPFIHL